jgi:predicted secreted hydrolase
MDREWSTSALEPDQAGWDWLSLQLDDRSELMFFRLRRKDGTTDPMSAGSFVDPSGSVHPLRAGDVDFGVSSTWRSPRSGGVYPSTIHLAVRGPDLDLSMTPLLADQELDLSFRYWEGAMRVGGRAAGAAVTGRGYLELTGYGENQARAR